MTRTRTTRSTFQRLATLALALGGIAALVSYAPARASADEEKCTVAIKGDSPVAQACQAGGVRQAKRKMKEMVRAARDKGLATDCNDCHRGADEWTLTKGAAEKFRRLVELTK